MTIDVDLSFFTKRGIPPHIRDGRPYRWWAKEDPTLVPEFFADCTPSQKGFVTHIVNNTAGWAITRHPMPGLQLPSILPELKPMTPVKTQPDTIHWHGTGPRPTMGDFIAWCNANSEYTTWCQKLASEDPHGPCPPKKILNGKPDSLTWRGHINRMKDPDYDHFTINVQGFHRHVHEGKYLFVPSEKMDAVRVHDHGDYHKDANRLDHIARHHPEGDVAGPHSHVWGRVPNPLSQTARRIDVHPMAVERIRKTNVIFFGIEGCPKADAMLADGAAVCSVPAVSLWDTLELNAFADAYLKGKTVVIIPDADWSTKPQVINQARLFQSALHRLGVGQPLVAAPPENWPGSPKGIDDFIHTGGHLEGLTVLDIQRNENIDYFRKTLEHQKKPKLRPDRIRRDLLVLEGLSTFAASHTGMLTAPLRTVARAMGVDRNMVQRTTKYLKELGLVTVIGDDDISHGRWVGNRYVHETEWVERPTLVLDRRLRAWTKERPITDVLPPAQIRPT